MCGIFALLNNQDSTNTINANFQKGKQRGPEFSSLNTNAEGLVLGFHRLAINGLNAESNQPFEINNIVLICNGEIYNYKQLYECLEVSPVTNSDCEVIIHMYLKYGMEQTLIMLDGVFAFVLYDKRNPIHKIYVARDPLGVRPLYYLTRSDHDCRLDYAFASEIKCLTDLHNNTTDSCIEQFTPGTFSSFIRLSKSYPLWDPLWDPLQENVAYFIPSFSHNWLSNVMPSNIIYSQISSYLNEAVIKRCLTTERPIACLLSGGLDSSLIAALVNNFYNINHIPNKLETYSIGLQDSEDLKYAKIVAEYLGTNHTEIIVTEQEMCDAIPEVIYAIESYDTTTVRASIGNYLLGKYIAKHSEAKVIFNGDGADELFGGYLYMHKCPDDIEFDKEIRRLLTDIHLFDVLRSDKCISSHGLEPRTPFLDKNVVNFVLSLTPYFRNHKNHKIDNKNTEKYILRHSFSDAYFKNYNNNPLLPDSILWRRKEAFSDGVSSQGRTLYKIIQEYCATCLNEQDQDQGQQETIYLPCIETEKYYYKQLFDKLYPNCDTLLPYFWMPKYIVATDPSARTLDLYK
jgi:asparagine synthase (glutamine-hydrolysing)